MVGNEVTIESADSVAVTDNRTFAVLNEWGVQPTAAPRTLMSPQNSWAEDETILDTGSHAEPNFDQVIAATPPSSSTATATATTRKRCRKQRRTPPSSQWTMLT